MVPKNLGPHHLLLLLQALFLVFLLMCMLMNKVNTIHALSFYSFLLSPLSFHSYIHFNNIVVECAENNYKIEKDAQFETYRIRFNLASAFYSMNHLSPPSFFSFSFSFSFLSSYSFLTFIFFCYFSIIILFC